MILGFSSPLSRRQISIYFMKYKKVGVLPIRIVKSNVWSVGPSPLSANAAKYFYLLYGQLYVYFRLYENKPLTSAFSNML